MRERAPGRVRKECRVAAALVESAGGKEREIIRTKPIRLDFA